VKKKYAKLFEPVQIGKLTLRNKIVMSPMHTKFMDGTAGDATFTHWYTEYFRERAKGGVGLIITGHIKAEKKVDPFPRKYLFPVLDVDDRIKEFAELTETVHRYGAKIVAQLSPGTGRVADFFQPGNWPAAPSELPSLYFPNLVTRQLTKVEITQLIEAFGKAADRVKRAGFDGLYIHGLIYLIDQFISSCWNHRVDEYGGNVQNRLRFLKECLESARSYTGDGFPVIIGLCLEHGHESGRKLEETIILAKEIEKLDVDAFHVRNGSYDSIETFIPNAHYPDGMVLKNAVLFRREIKTPIIVDGKFADPDLILNAIEDGKTDLIGMGRQLLADPQWPIKVKKGKVDEIRPCIRCMECLVRTRSGKYIGCSVNSKLGHERDQPVLPASIPKKVLVIGGGPAGMEAARVAASRGHNLTLVEKSSELGGLMLVASVPSYKYLIHKFNLWLQRQIRERCEIILGLEADESFIREKDPDVIVVAVGARPFIPKVPGIHMKNVLQAVDVLGKRISVGKKLVVIGGGPVGCDTAYTLASSGKSVDIIEMLPEILQGISVFNKHSLVNELSSLGVRIHVETKLAEVKDTGVVVVKDGKQNFIEADSIIIAAGFLDEDSTDGKFEELADEVYFIGDVVKARTIYDAIQEGYIVGKEI